MVHVSVPRRNKRRFRTQDDTGTPWRDRPAGSEGVAAGNHEFEDYEPGKDHRRFRLCRRLAANLRSPNRHRKCGHWLSGLVIALMPKYGR